MASAENDSRLIERVGRGDREAFEQLYQRFARPVLAMALSQLGDNGRAEDAAQETFAAVWRSAKSYRAERGTASAWLYAVARHAIIDRARQKRENAAEAPDEADVRAGPAEQAEESWLTWRVHSALELLPERERVVLELAYWSGLSQTEIASYLDVPLGTVKTRTRAGLARLAGLARGGKGVSDTPDFRDLVGDDLTPEEELRARPGGQPAPLGARARRQRFPAPSRTPSSASGRARPIWTRRRRLRGRRARSHRSRRSSSAPAAGSTAASTPARPCR